MIFYYKLTDFRRFFFVDFASIQHLGWPLLAPRVCCCVLVELFGSEAHHHELVFYRPIRLFPLVTCGVNLGAERFP